MKQLIVFLVMVGCAVCGICFQDQPYRLSSVFQPSDQAALDHRDSPYSSITWVASESENFLQLRFFDRVEGGACLHPSWSDLIAMAAQQPTLAHLVPKDGIPVLPPGPTWPFTWVPDPGALSNSPYIRLFPIGVLLNQHLMNAAKGDYHAARPRILVVGLGSGIGIATLAYHFPEAEITVVDIDHVVVDMVKEHYPLLHWLAQQKRADGAPRLRFNVRDARQFIRYDAAREAAAGHPYDVIILDAYTSGSTIPPHLMTREFYHQCIGVLGEHGILMANIIGSYVPDPTSDSTKYLVLGGAIRTLRAAGSPGSSLHVWNFPVLTNEDPGHFDSSRQRNNIVVTSRDPLDPENNAAGWQRLDAFVPYPELKSNQYMSASYVLVSGSGRDRKWLSSSVPAALLENGNSDIRGRLTILPNDPGAPQYPRTWESGDHEVIAMCERGVDEAIAKKQIGTTKGWGDGDIATSVRRMETDWVLAAQETFMVSVKTAHDGSQHSGEALVGDLPEGAKRDAAPHNWIISDAPLFTDQRPNADIFNN